MRDQRSLSLAPLFSTIAGPVKCLWGSRGLAERKVGGSGSRKTGLMVASGLGAAEYFF